MERDEKWAVIAAGRRELADLLDGATEADRDRPSLCGEWRVRDVAAHVALTPQSPGVLRIVGMGIRARGDFDALNRDLAVQHADRPGADLVAELRRLAASRSKPAITTLDNLLFDTLVHVQDVAVPLGRTVVMPPAAAREGAERVWRMGWPFWARRRLRGLRLSATDVDWAAGEGAEVRGPVRALLLLLTGRTGAALPELTGPGAARLSGAGTDSVR
ncbi:maleylpyruvate isomerase family mycothiol-dependent enzyme [Blastococcus sp. SYSU D00922]